MNNGETWYFTVICLSNISQSQWNINSLCGNMNSTCWVVSTRWFYAKSMEMGGSIRCYWKNGAKEAKETRKRKSTLTLTDHVLSVREHVSMLCVFHIIPLHKASWSAQGQAASIMGFADLMVSEISHHFCCYNMSTFTSSRPISKGCSVPVNLHYQNTQGTKSALLPIFAFIRKR